MSDQGFREIQLSGKQLVFLFMATVVVAVTVFLLGVSVGRGVRQSTTPDLQAATEAATPTEQAAPAELPPATQLTPADTRYSQLDRPEGAKTAASAASDVGASPDVTPVDEPMPEKAAAAETKAPAAPAPAPSAARGAATPKASDASDLPKAAANGQWVVQINAYRARGSAEREVAALKKKGYAAFVLAGGGSFYRVRVGPFRERAEADRTASSLTKEGFTPLVTR